LLTDAHCSASARASLPARCTMSRIAASVASPVAHGPHRWLSSSSADSNGKVQPTHFAKSSLGL
jgi:hypothetical protein